VVSKSLGLDRGTVRKYVAKAQAAGLVPGGPPPYPRPVGGPGAPVVPRAGRCPPSQPDPRRLRRPQGGHHRDDEDQHRHHGPPAVARRARPGRRHHQLPALRVAGVPRGPGPRTGHPTPPRPEVDPGEEAQIDYGFLGTWFDPALQRLRRVWAFVMVLACSRHMFVRPVLKVDQRSWVACHVAAFSFFGGAPRRLVPDNLKTGVDRPDLYDPKLNRAYAEMAAHYGTLIDPARGSKPKDKPRVERQMPYARDSMWRGRTWTSEADMVAGGLRWCTEVAGVRSHRGLEGATPLSVFDAVEAAALIGLPAVPFELASWSRPKVGQDCYVKVGPALYSVPWRHIGTTVDARLGDRTVEVYSGGAAGPVRGGIIIAMERSRKYAAAARTCWHANRQRHTTRNEDDPKLGHGAEGVNSDHPDTAALGLHSANPDCPASCRGPLICLSRQEQQA
jgi:hypothetical protein